MSKVEGVVKSGTLYTFSHVHCESARMSQKNAINATQKVRRILTYNDRTVTHLHIKWGVALGAIVVGGGTRYLPPSRIHAPVTNSR